MFSLIITIISIALVVALVAATMYYGGSALSQGTDAAEAAGLVSGAQQIVAAVTLYQNLVGAEPASVQALMDSKYLSSIPVTVAGEDWTLDAAARKVTIADPEATLNDAVCDRLAASGGTLYTCVKDAAAGPNTFTFNY